MTTPRPVSLSQTQFCAVFEAAKLVPVEWRSRFLGSVVDALRSHQPDDADVQQAITASLQRMEQAA